MSKQTDHLIIAEVRAGNTNAYAKLVTQYQVMIFTLAVRMLNDREEAEEVAQDVFVKAYQKLGHFKGQSKFSTWLYRIAYNACLDRLKVLKRTVRSEILDEVNESDLGEIQNGLSHLLAQERKDMINLALSKLEPEESAIITSFYFEELSLREIAVALNISESNVKVRLHRSRKKLFAILKPVVKTEII
ncbi:RNA polymerase sigma factor [Sungkyunkwania multivorans]|uniref:RNA polymerase sigma factor n=1 Tax=Sungkyunkwania multivorans TaxID=1173618 RepID=A0ABW3CW88_9FLAO